MEERSALSFRLLKSNSVMPRAPWNSVRIAIMVLLLDLALPRLPPTLSFYKIGAQQNATGGNGGGAG